MRLRMVRAGFALLAVLALAPLPAAAQAKASKPPRTPDGKPSLEGTFNFARSRRSSVPSRSPERRS